MALKVIKASGDNSADFDPKAEAVRLYQTGKGADSIAKLLGFTPAGIRAWLKAAGIARRDRSKTVTAETRGAVVSMYENGATTTAIAAATGLNVNTVNAILKKGGIRMRTPQESAALSRGVTVQKQKEALLLYGAGKTADEVEAEIGVSRATVYSLLRKQGVKARKSGTRTDDSLSATIVERYSSGESSNSIARALGMSHAGVTKILRRSGAAVRSRSDAIKLVRAQADA